MANFEPTAGYDTVPMHLTSDQILGKSPSDSISVGSARPANAPLFALVNNVEALKTGKLSAPSNCVLYGESSPSGHDPNFATFSSNVLTIDGTNTPLLLSFANGYTEFGTSQIVAEMTSAMTIDYTALTGQFMVFIVWNGTAFSLVSLALGTSNPRYHATYAKPAFDGADQFWFDPITNAMYRDVGGAGTWVKVNAIFLGGVLSGASDFWYGKPFGVPAFDKASPVGEIRIWHDAGSVPKGFVACLGATVKVAQFPDLFNAMGTVYSSTTPLDEFDLPNFSGESIGPGPTNVVYMMKAY